MLSRTHQNADCWYRNHREAAKGLAFVVVVAMSLVLPAFAQSPGLAPGANLALELNRGISIDRQFRCIPPESIWNRRWL